jgi:hypothetical protein
VNDKESQLFKDNSEMAQAKSHHDCTQKFIKIANELKDEGHDQQIVSAALMAASGVYATYVAVGNEGGLQPSGVDKVVMMYRRNLEHIQGRKKTEDEMRETASQEKA